MSKLLGVGALVPCQPQGMAVDSSAIFVCFSALDLFLNERREGRIASLGHHIAEKGGLDGVLHPTPLWALRERLTSRPSLPPLTNCCPWLISRNPRLRQFYPYLKGSNDQIFYKNLGQINWDRTIDRALKGEPPPVVPIFPWHFADFLEHDPPLIDMSIEDLPFEDNDYDYFYSTKPSKTITCTRYFYGVV